MQSIVPSWVSCQIGARQHYANPRTLYKVGQLAGFITDAWVPPRSLLSLVTWPFDTANLRRLRQRYHPELIDAPVHAFTSSLIKFELLQQSQGVSGWKRIIARNRWFQRRAVGALSTMRPRLLKIDSRPTILSFSYAALEIFRYAKSQGWRTVLEQIDPGPVEESIVAQEHFRYQGNTSIWQPAPPEYWDDWRKECSLADYILVNSSWTSRALQQVGIPSQKISLTPLFYEPHQETGDFVREYPSAFSSKRPLRVLFLGIVGLRKGVAALLEAAKILDDEPIEFWLVGPSEIQLRDGINNSKVHWIGPVTRGETAVYYKSADVFLFPTLSDGFGLTQLEAQAWKLPVIASRFCGEVVRDGENGIVLDEVDGITIAKALRYCLANPEQLKIFSIRAITNSIYGLSHLEPLLQFVLSHD